MNQHYFLFLTDAPTAVIAAGLRIQRLRKEAADLAFKAKLMDDEANALEKEVEAVVVEDWTTEQIVQAKEKTIKP